MTALIWILSLVLIIILNLIIGLFVGYMASWYLIFYILWPFVAKFFCDKWYTRVYKKEKAHKAKIEKIKQIEKNRLEGVNHKKFRVVAYNEISKQELKELKEINIDKFPESKYADGDTYYAIDTLRNGKKVRIYCTKEQWEEKRKKK